jgi:dephospho-CoA kinase
MRDRPASQPADRRRTREGAVPRSKPLRIIAISGLPGAGVNTVTRLLSDEPGTLVVSMGAYPRLRFEAELGPQSLGDEALIEFRDAKEKTDRSCWVRPFHRRLLRLLRRSLPARLIITGLLTETDIRYCRAIGARLIHLHAPAEVRRQRIGIRFPERRLEALERLDKLAASQPNLWDLILDTDEPYPAFVQSLRSQVSRL